jgi:HSP20 family molecular chaperone IbpA
MNIVKSTAFLLIFSCLSNLYCSHDPKQSFDINDIFTNSIHDSHKISTNHTSKKSIEIKDLGQKIEISISVPNVENSDSIKAYASKGRLKVIIPQKNTITKIVIDQNSIKTVAKKHMEQKHQSKTAQSFSFSSSQRIELESLPSPVDITERTVEYKENDVLLITLNKAQENNTMPKAQPRTIPVINK